MKKFFAIFALIVSLFALCSCDVADMGSLSDLSKPYAGQYECTRLTLGSEDMTGKFEYVRLELRNSGAFELSYRTAEGSEGSYGGEYSMNTETGELTLSAKTPLRTISHKFPVENGVILVDFNFRGKLLHAEFEMP